MKQAPSHVMRGISHIFQTAGRNAPENSRVALLSLLYNQ
jgi:hypothetical protein